MWLPVGGRCLAAALHLPRVADVRPLIPPELEIVSVLPGRTVGSWFLADYGPGSTLVYSEFGICPALVRHGSAVGFFNTRMVVDCPRSVAGGRNVGIPKVLGTFEWEEESPAGGRVRGACLVSLPGGLEARIRYRQGSLPLPTPPFPLLSLRDDMLFSSTNEFRGEARLGHVEIEVRGPDLAGDLAALGPRALALTCPAPWRGRLLDRLKVAAFLPDRNPTRPEAAPRG